jgi:uncharacterized protein YdhG (YjbR/CyaY superfamily)
MKLNSFADKRTAGEAEVLEAINAMPDDDRAVSERLHAVIMNSSTDIVPRTWYGMPAYAVNNKIVCFFRSKKKFGERYMTLGFNDVAKLDDGTMWPITFAITDLTDAEETAVAALMKKALT